MSETEKWTERLKPGFEYNIKYSNMSKEQALDIVETVFSYVIDDIKSEEEYSNLESMLERALDKYRNVAEAVK